MEILVITGTSYITSTNYIISSPGGSQVAYSQYLTTGDVITGCLLLAILVVVVYGRIISVGRGNR